jgi:penicillin-binding protein 1B
MAGKKKKQTRRKKTGRSRRKPVKRPKSAKKRSRLLLYILLPSILIVVIYAIYLDYIIRDRFEGNRWQIPARVYASPMELYAGLGLQRTELIEELKRLNYRKVNNSKEAGTYMTRPGEVLLTSRPFRFWDGSEPSQTLRILFNQQGVSQLEQHPGRESVSLVRLDPVHIASIYPHHNEDRVLVQLTDVPVLLQKGLVEVEDRKFRNHHGIDFIAIARALYTNIKAGKTVQGGSTLTQQLVKNYFLTSERSLTRKINEAMMSALLELHYDKDDILQSYLNEVYLGQDGQRSINGFGLASQFYFGRALKYLKPQQIALLIGLVKGPSYYDPRKHPERATGRRNLVLDIMHERGLLDKKDRDKYKKSPLTVTRVQKSAVTAYPAFLDLVKRQLRRDYADEDLSSAGLRIFTTLRSDIQLKTEQALSGKLTALERGYRLADGRLQGAVIVTDVNSAEVLAIVGDRRPRYTGFNRALDAVRSIGSLVKPAVYLAALMTDKYTLASLLDDDFLEVEQDHEDQAWAPQNYDKQYHGQVPLFQALAHSYNVATVRLGMDIGLSSVVNLLSELGVRRPVNRFPSTLLGTLALSPLEVAQMYQTLANSGFYSPLRSIRAVLDINGEPLNRYPLSVSQVVDAEDSLLINYGLHLVTQFGTAGQLRSLLPQGLQAAGKTGTTDNLRDSWFAGYTQDYLSVVWLGHDDDKPTKFTGSSGAMQVWAALFNKINAQPLQLDVTDDIEMAWIDVQTGNRTDENCKNAVELPFKRGTVPEQFSDCSPAIIDWLNRIF